MSKMSLRIWLVVVIVLSLFAGVVLLFISGVGNSLIAKSPRVPYTEIGPLSIGYQATPTQEVAVVQVLATAPMPSATPTFNMTPVRTEIVQTAVPFRTSTPTKVVTTTSRVAVLSLQTAPCSLTDKTVQMAVDQKNGDWHWNPGTIDQGLRGCNFLAEGRKDTSLQEHHIWILGVGPSLTYLDGDGMFHCKECSIWAYPSGWNMGDFNTPKPPIAAEFVNAKANNMKDNTYSWPIFVHLADGVNTRQFQAGVMVNNVTLPNNCSFTEPQRHKITGVYDPSSGSFTASIGAQGCKTAAWINGSTAPILWDNAKDNVGFNTIIAYLIPKAWTADQINTWAATAPK